jgi:hypothetical protein
VDHQAVPGGVVAEAVGRLHGRDDLSFTGFLELAAAGPLGYVLLLELRHPAPDVAHELAHRGVVARVVEGPELRGVVLEERTQVLVVPRLAADPVEVLSEHDGDSSAGDELPHPVHAGPLKRRTAVAGVRDLFEDL